MKHRKGLLVLASGMAVLCAGILSTGSDSWKKMSSGDLELPLDTSGVHELVIDRGFVGILTIAEEPAQIRFMEWQRTDPSDAAGPVRQLRDGELLRLQTRTPLRQPNLLNLTVRPGIGKVSAGTLDIRSKVNAGVLDIEAYKLDWQGNAESLDIRANALPVGECVPGGVRTPTVTFSKGTVARIQISIERGMVSLGDLSNVKSVELHAGPNVGLTVNAIEDLGRITMYPFDREPTPPPVEPTSDRTGRVENCGEANYPRR